MSRDIVGSHNLGDGEVATGGQTVEAGDATKRPVMHRTAPQRTVCQMWRLPKPTDKPGPGII